jgi:hypothetical protein
LSVAKAVSARSKDKMSFERTSTEARGDTGEEIPQDSVRLSEVVAEGNRRQEGRPICPLLVTRLRQSIAAGHYLTPAKIHAAVKRLRWGLFGE